MADRDPRVDPKVGDAMLLPDGMEIITDFIDGNGGVHYSALGIMGKREWRKRMKDAEVLHAAD